jgi:hypothetical protein
MPQTLNPETASYFCYKIALLAKNHRISVTSWLRTRRRNAADGGTDNSAHLYGLAVDVVPDDAADKPLLIAAAERLGLVALDEGDHVHLRERTPSSGEAAQ